MISGEEDLQQEDGTFPTVNDIQEVSAQQLRLREATKIANVFGRVFKVQLPKGDLHRAARNWKAPSLAQLGVGKVRYLRSATPRRVRPTVLDFLDPVCTRTVLRIAWGLRGHKDKLTGL